MKKMMTKLGLTSVALFSSSYAFAASQLPVGWDADVTDAKTDAITVGVTFILAIIAIRAVYLIAKRG